ncbi:MAG: IPTL-CTERM sorting domain-containing protein [Candidatus Magnetomorum sp.]|nr:IPTL-CTERM sorting domain-containing protein [Candidatus Magnetomorum sp.]
MGYLNYLKLLSVTFMSLAIIAVFGHYDCSLALDEVAIVSNSHAEPSSLTTINIGWTYATVSTINGYYYTLTSLSSYTVDASDVQISNNAADDINLTVSDGTYYFYIAPYQAAFPAPPTMGPTTKAGPLTVDTTSPGNLSVTGPDTTDTELVSLTIGADEIIDQVCISETTYGNCGWNNFTAPGHEYSLQAGEGQYLLYIQVKDVAGNLAQATPYALTYTTSDNIRMAQYTSVPTLTEWGMILFFSILLMLGIMAMRRSVSAIQHCR